MIGNVLLVAAIITVIATILDFMSSDRSKGATVAGSIITFIASCVVFFLLFWTGTPPFEGASWVWILLWACLIPLVVFGLISFVDDSLSATPIGAAVGIIAVLVTWCFYSHPITGKGAKQLASTVNITMEDKSLSTYPDTDINHILIVPEQAAEAKANQALNQAKDVNTYYDLDADGVLQSVNSHLYYIYQLTLEGRRNQEKMSYTVPGYVVVDAENPDAQPQLKLGFKMQYVPKMPYSYSVNRLLWGKYKGYYIDGLSMEVDDNWKPYYSASLNKPARRWLEAIPKKMIILDPQTGNIEEHQLNKVPEWVDRVYSAKTAETMLNWWGKWGQAPYKMFFAGTGNRYKVASSTVVYTKGGHPAYQMLMTSEKSDTAVNYIALFDTRSNNVKIYPAPAGMTLESVASTAISGASNNVRKRQPTHLTLHSIYGRLTWVAPMVPEGGNTYAGLGLVEATHVSADKSVVGNSKSEALGAYNEVLARTTDNSNPNENANIKSVTAKVVQYNQVVTASGTFAYILLAGDTSHSYKVAINDEKPEVVFTKVGDTVTITYIDTGIDTTRREIRTLDNTALQLNK